MSHTQILRLWTIGLIALIASSLFSQKQANMNYNPLTDAEQYVILKKGTERSFIGKYTTHKEKGTYTCKQCNAPLYYSTDKFESSCGWPSFDDEIKGAVKRVADRDGERTEIVCSNCGAHLGHVFLNEGFTQKMTRHCVNSISLNFVPKGETLKQTIRMNQQKAYFASGCFWGTEYYFAKLKGVTATAVGFMGGHVKNPTYKEVCTKTTGHVEVCELTFDPTKVSYEELTKYFFETHDFTQTNGQGPDIGPQYLSVIFYQSADEKKVAEKVVAELSLKGYKVATQLRPAETFYKAEDYHQQYYDHKGSTPYCHKYTPIF